MKLQFQTYQIQNRIMRAFINKQRMVSLLPKEDQPQKHQNKIDLSMNDIKLEEEEKELLVEVFQKIKDDENLINKYSFRMEVLGAQVPDVIAERFFCIFASVVSSSKVKLKALSNNEAVSTITNSVSEENLPDKMDFQDLVQCYHVFKYKIPQDVGQLCFEVIKLTKEQNVLNRDDLVHWAVRILQLSENFVNLYYKRSEFDPRVNITKIEFMQIFEKVQTIEIFSLVPQLLENFKPDFLNVKKQLYARKSIALTGIHLKMVSKQTEDEFGIAETDVDNVREFFLDAIIGQSSEHILFIYRKLFENIKSSEIKNFLLYKITKFKANDFEFFMKIVGNTVTSTTVRQKLQFFFEMATDFGELMTKENCVAFCKLFRGKPPQDFPMTEQQFLDHFEGQDLDRIDSFLEAKSMMIGMMGIKSDGSHREQQEAIGAVLGQPVHGRNSGDNGMSLELHFDLERYIYDHLPHENTFFVIDKKFWDDWSKEPQENRKVMETIDNMQFILPGHELRWRENLIWKKDFMLVPKFVYKAFCKWYKCNKVIEITKTVRSMDKRPATRESQFGKQSQFGDRQNTNEQEERGEGQSIPGSAQKNENESFKLTNIPSIIVKNIEVEADGAKFDLQIYPKFFYFQAIDSSGNLPHQACVLKFDIDQGYMKKYIKTSKVPFFELSISKNTKMDEIQSMLTEHFGQVNKKRARLLINDEIITGLKLQMTVEEMKLETGTLIYVEILSQENIWPTEQNKEADSRSKQETNKGLKSQHTIGLYNMGNTCYMNAALQCLANTKHFYEYFVQKRIYSVQINRDNAMGHKGSLVEAFAAIMHQMWNSDQVVVPKLFRHTIAKINENFGSDDQQDTQEYIGFLIDGLHEDTNMRNDKPYFEAPESEGKELIELGLETWSKNLSRDWSFIYFMFYGQTQSTLECQTCMKKSIKYDSFANIPVSLPEPSKILLNVIVHRLPSAIKQIISPVDGKDAEMQFAGNDDEIFSTNYTRLTNDQPIHVCVKIQKSSKISTLLQKIVSIKEVNIDQQQFVNQGFTTLLLYNKNLGTVRGILDPEKKLTNYKMITNEIHAQEVLTPRGKEYVIQMYQHNGDWIRKHTHCLSNLVEDHHLWAKQYAEDSARTIKTAPFSMQYIFNNHYAACEKYELLLSHQKMPTNVIAVAYHRRFVRKTGRLFSDLQPQLLASPVLVMLPLYPTGRRIYEEVWAMAQILLRKESKFLNPKKQKNHVLWWTDPNWLENMETIKKEGILQPFVLKWVDRNGYNCSRCNWTQRCSGCVIEPTDDEREVEFMKYCHIAIEWDSVMIEEEYNATANENLKHISSDKVELEEEDSIITLESCLSNFHNIEKLDEEVNCEKCKVPRMHTKSLQTFRLPAILTIQLKRFKKIGNNYRKQNNTVEFPFSNLDMGPYVQDQNFLRSLGVSLKYDLFGIINHYGSLTYGHYISVVKNPFSGKWYKYDDQRRIEVKESQITKEHAYVLFYVRKDVEQKKIGDLFPDSEVIFPGKPVNTRFGKGFVLGAKEGAEEKTYYVKIEQEVFEVKQPDFVKNKADRYIQACEVERLELEQNQLYDQQQGTSSVFQNFMKLFFEPNKGKIKDVDTEKTRLISTQQEETKEVPQVVLQITEEAKGNPDDQTQDQIELTTPQPQIAKTINDSDIQIDGNQIPQPTFGAEMVGAEGDSQKQVVKKKKKKKSKKANVEQASGDDLQ